MASDGSRLSCYFFILRLRLILWMAHAGDTGRNACFTKL